MHCLRMVLTSDAATVRGTIKIHRLPSCHLKDFQPVPFILMLISTSRDICFHHFKKVTFVQEILISDIYEGKFNLINLYLI